MENNERLGDLAGTATGTSQMGVLLAAQGRPAHAIVWHVRALAIRQELGVPQAWIDVRALKVLRAELGTEQFVAAIGNQLDDANRANLVACWTVTRQRSQADTSGWFATAPPGLSRSEAALVVGAVLAIARSGQDPKPPAKEGLTPTASRPPTAPPAGEQCSEATIV